ncbi:MAG: tripartite tricarboxylate transporter TctB family protein [Spirochaeta sp.]|nr:tripartite tricarboxylate transporter TctB family protein [Spirochaeta sp.]
MSDDTNNEKQTGTTETRTYSLNFPIILFLVGVTTLVFASQLPVFMQRGARLPGPQFFPTILGVFFCLAGVVELMRYVAWRRRKAYGSGDQSSTLKYETTAQVTLAAQAEQTAQVPPAPRPALSARIEQVAKNWGNQTVALLLVALLVFVLVLPVLGFVLTGFLFSLVVLLRLNAKPAPAVLLSLALVVLIAFIFVSAFRVPLPRGILSLPF